MGAIIVTIGVDWEGRSLLTENLNLVSDFRDRHPEVPFQHFLNPAYFTRPHVDLEATRNAIKLTLRPDDDHGLHIHPWHSLLYAAKVTPIPVKTYYDSSAPPMPKASDDWGFYSPEAGYDGFVEDYAPNEVERLIKYSRLLLCDQGYREATTFRAGAWVSGSNVQSALVSCGFKADCSAVDIAPVIARFGDCSLSHVLKAIWPDVTDTTQPFKRELSNGTIWQIPDNGILADYRSADEMVYCFTKNVESWKKNPTKHQFVSFGFHQETARFYLHRLENAIRRIKLLALKDGLPLMFSGNPQAHLQG